MKTPTSGLTPGQALYVLDRLLGEKRVSAREIARLAAEMQREIAALEQRLAALRQQHLASDVRSIADQPRERAATRRKANPELIASRRIQGEYMGLIRHLTGAKRAQVKRLAAEKGREAAIKEMRAFAGK